MKDDAHAVAYTLEAPWERAHNPNPKKQTMRLRWLRGSLKEYSVNIQSINLVPKAKESCATWLSNQAPQVSHQPNTFDVDKLTSSTRTACLKPVAASDSLVPSSTSLRPKRTTGNQKVIHVHMCTGSAEAQNFLPSTHCASLHSVFHAADDSTTSARIKFPSSLPP